MKVITVTNQNGGVSKTTTAATIAQALQTKGKKTLLIDADGQEGLTETYIETSYSFTLYDVIKGNCTADEAIVNSVSGDIIPGSELIANIDVELNKVAGRDNILKMQLEPLKNKYDYIIIDTAPGLGTALIQSLVAADGIIIPVVADPKALKGLNKILDTVEQVQKYVNSDLKVFGVIITQHGGRATLTKQYTELIEEYCKTKKIRLAKTPIRKGIAIQEAQALKENLYDYAPKSNPAIDYLQAIKELKL